MEGQILLKKLSFWYAVDSMAPIRGLYAIFSHIEYRNIPSYLIQFLVELVRENLCSGAVWLVTTLWPSIEDIRSTYRL